MTSLRDCNAMASRMCFRNEETKYVVSPADKVLGLVAQDLEVHWLVAEGVSCEDVYSPHNCTARRLIVVE